MVSIIFLDLDGTLLLNGAQELRPESVKKPQKKEDELDRPRPQKKEDAKEQTQPQRKSKPQPEEKKAARPDDEAKEVPVTESAESTAAEAEADEKALRRKTKGKKPGAPREKAEKPREAMIPAEVFQPSEPPVLYPEDSAAGVAQRFLMELTEKMGVKVEVYVEKAQDNLVSLRVIGDTLGILIGRRGETLDAIQYLTSLQVNRGNDEYIRVVLDTENYRAKREDSLRRLAVRMANRAQKTGRRVVMEPMNPYERRVMHTALQDHPAVTTHSEGEEPNRRVVILLKNGESKKEDKVQQTDPAGEQKLRRKRSHRRSRKPKTNPAELPTEEMQEAKQTDTESEA